MRLSSIFKGVAFAVLASASVAAADTVNIGGYDSTSVGNGEFVGTLSYNPATAVLDVHLTNNASAASGNYITGVVFNVQDIAGVDSLAAYTSGIAGFSNLGASNDPPFGDFEAGAALGGSFTGGGSPTGGIAIGASGDLYFHVTGAKASQLTAASFISEASTGASQSADFLVRFRGGANSAKSSGTITTTGGSPSTPLPSGALGGTALLALLGGCQLRKRNVAQA